MKSTEIKDMKHADGNIVKIISGGGCIVGSREKIYRYW